METIGELDIWIMLAIPIVCGLVAIIFCYSLTRGFMPWELLWEYIDKE